MRSPSAGLDAPVLRRAVTTYLALEDDLAPRPRVRGVGAPGRAPPGAGQAGGTVKLAPPPPPSVRELSAAQARRPRQGSGQGHAAGAHAGPEEGEVMDIREVTVRYGRTANLGNFESERVDVGSRPRWPMARRGVWC